MAELDMPSFTEVNWEEQERADARLIESVTSANPEQSGQNEGLFDMNRPLDAGEKADDAEDFEDISDDDLPDEEEATGNKEDEAPGLTDDVDMGLGDDDDLFGDNDAATPYDHFEDEDITQGNEVTDIQHINGGLTLPSVEPVEDVADLRALNFPGLAAHDDETPGDYEGDDDFIQQNWPSYDKDTAINLTELFPPRPAHFIPKAPVKPPKPVNPTKVSLDLAADQEKGFRVAGPARFDKNKWIAEAEAKGLVAVVEESSEEAESDDEFDFAPLDRAEKLGGLSMTDIEIACADWESSINPPQVLPEGNDEPLDEWEQEFLGYSSKRKHQETDLFSITPIYPVPNFDNFEQLTAQVAKRVVLDLNDPLLLVDTQEPNQAVKRRRLGPRGNFKAVGAGSFASSLSARFNMSNDEAYEALKENHQSKIRATLGNISVEHSLPAQKLQFPYYHVKMDAKDLRAYHRKTIKLPMNMLNQPIFFSKPGGRKRKAVKNLPTTEIFKEAKDLSLGEQYASAALLEYSEEHPTVLSNFGMGNRIVNYYRRKGADDADRPGPEDKVGDTTVLLPEDKSPFSNFGMVDPGETVRAIHNQMYRAPIFKHQAKSTDFLVIRSYNNASSSWHIRNIDNLFIVGQQFPSMEIPGPHSRKVTNAAKNRMKMIAYRKIRHSKDQHLKIGEITRHIVGSTDMQNRQKLKEFMSYDKGEKVWRMKAGDVMPDETSIRAMVKPEEVCVIDAMQVGSQHLEDAGYVAGEEDDLNEKEDQSLEQNLAPWRTTKAFLEASADKAMLQLHGEGDPSGRGSAFSFIKTSMKGGYLDTISQGPMASSAARIVKNQTQSTGHTYNVKAQQTIYNEAIRRIWEQQKSELSNPEEPEALGDMEGIENSGHGIAGTPAPFDDDDNVSHYSMASKGQQGKVMRITRTLVDAYGQEYEETEDVKDPKVWHRYEKLCREKQGQEIDPFKWQPTGDPEADKIALARVRQEHERLLRNKDRRQAREKQKLGQGRGKKGSNLIIENGDAVSPSSTPLPSTEKPAGTTRKCANCGQAGHIKTNKKYCDTCLPSKSKNSVTFK